jgi:uncharacterized membrane protein YbhN (UPF0104 family)
VPVRFDRVADTLRRFPVLRNALVFLKDAEPHLTRHPRLLLEAVVWQTVIVLLDAGSLWVLIRSLGTTAPPEGVFASFMISSVFRAVGIVPGGLGIFEATSVWILNMMGVSIPTGLTRARVLVNQLSNLLLVLIVAGASAASGSMPSSSYYIGGLMRLAPDPVRLCDDVLAQHDQHHAGRFGGANGMGDVRRHQYD